LLNKYSGLQELRSDFLPKNRLTKEEKEKNNIPQNFMSMESLERLTGISYRTIRKRLGDREPDLTFKGTTLYNTTEIIPLLFKGPHLENTVDLNRERARLASRQAELAEIKIAISKGKYISTENLEEALKRVFSAMRSQLLALPSKVAPYITGLTTHEIEDAIKREVYEALTELSNFDLDSLKSELADLIDMESEEAYPN
jgi:hypothetical protein